MRALLIDPFEKAITELDLDMKSSADIQPIYKAIEATSFDSVRIEFRDGNGQFNYIYVDGEGLFDPNKTKHAFKHVSYYQPLAGKGLVLGVDQAGETIATNIPLDVLTQSIEWVSLTDDQVDEFSTVRVITF